jgi:aerotolerance regulator-like protein/VWA domain-containing protein
MGFLAPWFLAGVAAVGLPLWLHLLRQYRSTPHPFSSLMFFERRLQSSLKHRRLRYLLLLSLRVALLILMALAFANPFVTRAVPAISAKKLLVVAVDRSFSMRYGDHLSRAKRQAADALSRLQSGERAQIIALDSQSHLLTQPTDDSAQLRAAIDSIQPGDGRSSYGEFARALRTTAESVKAPLEIHFFTDLQQSSMPPSFADLQLPPGAALFLHSVAEAKAPNWLVESVIAPGKLFEQKKARVQAVVAGHATDAARRTVSLVVDGRVLESKSVDVPANGRASVEFVSLESPYGFHRGEVRIDSADSLREDDRFPFAVERADPRRILFLHPAGQNRAVLYYRSALESAPQAGLIVEPLAVEQAVNQTLSKYAFIVLADVGAMPAGLEDQLRVYVQGGGALLAALGPNSASRRRAPVFDEAIEGSAVASRQGERFETVGSLDAQHPALRNSSKLEGVRFFQAVRVDPGKSRVIARLADQTPLLLEKQIGEGRALVFASSFDGLSNDFPLHASFLPFIEQSARYLSGQQDKSSNVAVDSYVDLRASKGQGASVEVIDPEGKRPLSLKESSAAQAFQVTREGFYELHRAGDRDELIAVHADRRESDLAQIPQETLDLWKNTGTPANAPAASGSAASEQTRPWSLWRYALLLVLLAAVAESLLAGRYLSIEKDTA